MLHRLNLTRRTLMGATEYITILLLSMFAVRLRRISTQKRVNRKIDNAYAFSKKNFSRHHTPHVYNIIFDIILSIGHASHSEHVADASSSFYRAIVV